MTDEAWKALTIIIPSTCTIVFGFIYRLISHREHRKTGRQVNDIYLLMNGDTKKKLEQEYERGKREAEEKK